jgi:hypothetical protein
MNKDYVSISLVLTLALASFILLVVTTIVIR